MPTFLTQEWFDATRDLAQDQPDGPGLSVSMQCIVSGGPEGEVRFYSVLEDGKLRDSRLGNTDDPELTFTLSYDDAILILQGELDPNVAYMQGRLKPAGDMAKFMQLMPATKSPEYEGLQEKIRTITDF
jgi:hypothetical protein